MTDGPLTLMVVHAHPDDEASSTGGILARYAAEGVRTVLVTCTDGRCGDGADGSKPGEVKHDPDAVVAQRRTELDASAAILGVSHLELLNYPDSGMMGWPQNDTPGSFWTTPVDQAAAPLAELMRKYRPDVVVTYDEIGFYGHPDHIQAHRITMAAAELTAIPSKVYWITAPRSWMAGFEQMLTESIQGSQGTENAPDGHGENAAAPEGGPVFEIGVPDEEVTTWVDTKAFGGKKFDALATHASQSDNVMFIRMGREKFTEMMGTETFLRVRDRTGAPLPEDDLFAGLRADPAPTSA